MQRRVLLVEHHRRVALALEGMITKAGHRVVARATQRVDALRKIVALDPDVVMIDMGIPGGIELAGTLRDTRSAVVMLTADAEAACGARQTSWVSTEANPAELAVAIELACRDAA